MTDDLTPAAQALLAKAGASTTMTLTEWLDFEQLVQKSQAEARATAEAEIAELREAVDKAEAFLAIGDELHGRNDPRTAAMRAELRRILVATTPADE